MGLSRREFIKVLGLASAAGMLPESIFAKKRAPSDLYEIPKFGNVRLMHITDCHAQLLPIYFREPNVNIGVGKSKGQPPHLVGNSLLSHYELAPGTVHAHAYTFLNFTQAAEKYGKVGGFAQLTTLVKKLRADAGEGHSLLLDGGTLGRVPARHSRPAAWTWLVPAINWVWMS